MKKFISLVLLIIVTSCNGQIKTDEKELMNCINQKINENTSEVYGETDINFYSLMNKVEEMLIESKLLKGSNQNDYIKFIKDIQDKNIDVKKSYQKIVYFLETNKYEHRFAMNISIVFGVCHNNILINENNEIKSTVSTQYQILSKLKAQGFENYKLINRLIIETKKEDFNKIVYRSPIILLSIINMGYQVNGVPKKAKFN